MNFDEFMRTILFLPDAGTDLADSIDHLHFVVIMATMLGSFAVAVLAVYWVVRFRRRGRPSATPHFRAPKWFEISWIGGLLTLFIALWVVGFRQYVEYATPPTDAEDVYVTGKQWMWKFEYPNGRTSTGILVVPEQRRIRLVMTSRDVIHSFFVPAFRVKQDLLPGRYTNVWFEARETGVYPVYCAEFCGTSHSRMWASIVVVGADDYGRWLSGDVPEVVARAGSRPRLQGAQVDLVGAVREQSMAERGRKAASEHGCLSCHTTNGQSHIGPTWAGLFGKTRKLDGGGQVVADEQYLTRSMMDPQSQIVEGFRSVMPTYLGTLPQPQAAAIVEYIKSLEDPEFEPSTPIFESNALEQGAAGAPAVLDQGLERKLIEPSVGQMRVQPQGLGDAPRQQGDSPRQQGDSPRNQGDSPTQEVKP